MKDITFFDKFILFFIAAACFAVGLHIGENKADEKEYYARLTVNIEKMSGTPIADVLVDGKYDCSLVSFGNGEVVLSCEGFLSEAGFLLSGAKYISKNQPIKAFSGSCYFEGRIISISLEPDD